MLKNEYTFFEQYILVSFLLDSKNDKISFNLKDDNLKESLRTTLTTYNTNM
jgi:hypothetical protein